MKDTITIQYIIFLFLLTSTWSIPTSQKEVQMNTQRPEIQVDPPEYMEDRKFSSKKMNMDEMGPYLGGDMVVPPEQYLEMIAKSGIVGQQYRWPKGQIPYVIDSSFTSSEKKTILNAMNEIQSKTCIKLVPRPSQSSSYIDIVRGTPNSGCYSSVGMQPIYFQPQRVNIQPGNPGCVSMGVIAHELIHAIGYYHEQSRSDRDDYVTINWNNIKSGQNHNFDKYTANQVNPYGIRYDYDSIMHYSAYAFAADTRKATIQPKQSNVPLSTLGQRNGLSGKDAEKINAMYKGICP